MDRLLTGMIPHAAFGDPAERRSFAARAGSDLTELAGLGTAASAVRDPLRRSEHQGTIALDGWRLDG